MLAARMKDSHGHQQSLAGPARETGNLNLELRFQGRVRRCPSCRGEQLRTPALWEQMLHLLFQPFPPLRFILIYGFEPPLESLLAFVDDGKFSIQISFRIQVEIPCAPSHGILALWKGSCFELGVEAVYADSPRVGFLPGE